MANERVTKTPEGDYLYDNGFSAPKLMVRSTLSAGAVNNLEALAAQSQSGGTPLVNVSPDRMAAVAQQTGLTMPATSVDTGPSGPAPGRVSLDVGAPTPLPLAGQTPAAEPQQQSGATPQSQTPQMQAPGMSPSSMAPGLPGFGGGGMAIQTTTQVMPKLSRSDIDGLSKAADMTAAAEAKAIEVKAQGMAKQAEIQQLDSMRQGFQNAAEQESEAARQNEINAQMADIQESVKEYNAKEVDPDRRWKSMGGGSKAGTVISLMLGAMGAAFTKGPNYALEQYERSIDRDIDAQKTEIAKSRDAIGLKNNMMSQLMAKGTSERQAQAALRVQRMEELQTGIKAEMLRDDSAEVQARGNASLAAAEERKRKFLTELKLATQDRTTIQMAPNTAGSKAMQEVNERAVGLPGGGVAYAPDAESARKLREQSSTTMSIQNKTDRLIQLTKSYVGKSLPGQVKDEAKGLITDLVSDYAKAKQAGALSDDEFERMAGLFKDPTSVFVSDSRAIAAAQAFRQRSDAQFINTLRANRMLGQR